MSKRANKLSVRAALKKLGNEGTVQFPADPAYYYAPYFYCLNNTIQAKLILRRKQSHGRK